MSVRVAFACPLGYRSHSLLPTVLWLVASALSFMTCVFRGDVATQAADESAVSRPVSFIRDIRPILAKHCFACHGPDEGTREAKLRLDQQTGATGPREGGAAFVPGKPDSSVALARVVSADPEQRMPPPEAGPPLSAEQIDLLRRWVAQGASWQSHWAFEKIARPQLPTVKDATWSRNAIDRFILARLEQEGLRPAPAADPAVLARRVALDLTGLPPSPELSREYLADPSNAAYERLVDRLLESKTYGERWARVWLDLARYADTRGYEKDRTRTIWRYRDWVIDAFNADLPYDQFTRDQLAGDLLPSPTMEQLLATAMHRNTMVNEEGGTDDEEFRVAAVKDRVDTTVQVWMGLTMGCGKCHSHKYDPISQREYYQFFAFFNQTEDSDKGDERPVAPTPTADQQRRIGELHGRLARLEEDYRQLLPTLREPAAAWARVQGQRRGWLTLKPIELTAESGATLKTLDDLSILASGPLPKSEQYKVVAELDAAAQTAAAPNTPAASPRTIGGLRIEALPDPSQPRGGAGRSKDDGNFVLTGLKLEVRDPAGETTVVPLTRAEADFAQQNYPVDHVLKNPDPAKHGWAVSPQQAKPHSAVFAPDAPLAIPAGAQWIVTLDHRFQFSYPGFALGRFRLSVTSDPQPKLQDDVPADLRKLLLKTEADRTDGEWQRLLEHFARTAPQTAELREKIAAVQEQIRATRPVETPILRELPSDKRRVTRIHVRGNFLEPGDTVQAAVPASFHPLPADAPPNRLGVAAWLCSPENPLTARVAANRLWSQLLGNGLVETQEDFGSQGQPPSHPELLDWLSAEFMQPAAPSKPWSWKALCKTIVMSATYRQSSRVAPELADRDRFNRLYARGARFRLDAETLRDNALAVSGLLSSKMYGPSVMPPQPDGIWRSTYNTDKWVTSAGEDRYRRGLYTFVKRTSPYPAMTTFDAPSREICTIRRSRTNTPLQSLVTLNDPAFVECAQSLARRAWKESPAATTNERVGRAIELALTRTPRPAEIATLVELYSRRLNEFRADNVAAKRFATEPLGPVPDGVDIAELAALTAVCNVILNLDEFLTRG
jgi:mono/diheme cytochrome c family protein